MFFELGPIASMPHFGFVWSILPCFLIYLGSCLGKGMMVLSLKARSSALSLCALCWLTPLVEEPACEVHVFVGLLRESFGERIQVKNYLCTVPIISFELVWLFNFLFFFYINHWKTFLDPPKSCPDHILMRPHIYGNFWMRIFFCKRRSLYSFLP